LIFLLDIMMPGSDGLETLRKIKEIHPDGQVIMLTALNTARTAFTAKETGAFDYVTKPFDVDELRLRVDRALEKSHLAREIERLQEEVGRKYGIENIIGNSRSMMEIYKTVSLVAKRKSTVLITGESGTGKELIARAIHYNSDRRNKAFVVVNCAALPDSLIESELFGYEKGAFTNAYQRKIGHFESETFIRLGGNEESKVDVRIIAASNRELEKLARDGGFRADLFYRLNVVSVCLPTLRERRDDIPVLVDHFLKLKARENGVAAKKMTADVIDRLVSYSWPGNVRELENLIERLTILTASDTVALGDLPLEMRSGQPAAGPLKEEVLEGSRPLGEAVDEFERAIILKALKKTGFNQTKAAALLGTSRRVLRYRMEKLQIAEDGPAEEDCAKLST
jgi:DNA-binding NtrC family response regulator